MYIYKTTWNFADTLCIATIQYGWNHVEKTIVSYMSARNCYAALKSNENIISSRFFFASVLRNVYTKSNERKANMQCKYLANVIN